VPAFSREIDRDERIYLAIPRSRRNFPPKGKPLVNLFARESVLESARDVIGPASPGRGIIPLREMPRFSLGLHALMPIACIAAGNRTPLDTLDPAFFIDATASRVLQSRFLPPLFNRESNTRGN